MKLNFKEIIMTIFLSFGLLWLLDAFGLGTVILNWIGERVPIATSIPSFTIGTYVIAVPAVAALIATVVLAAAVTFIAVSMQEGFQDKKMWGTFAVLAIISAALWIIVPQILPIRFGQLAGAAQAVFTGTVPMSVLG
jgi:hypothetical protein